MRYMCLLKATPESEHGGPPDPAVMAKMGELAEEGTRAGVLLGTEGLHPTSQGFRARLAEGKFTITDGPFTESKELVASYALIRVNSREEAIPWIERVLSIIGEGEFEIRQMEEVEDFDPALAPQFAEIGESISRVKQDKAQRYLCLLTDGYESDPTASGVPTPELMAEMGRFIGEATEAGVLLMTEGVKRSSTGFKVRLSGGNFTVTDGPFTETKELISSYALVQADARDEVVPWLERLLTIIGGGNVEVRRILSPSDVEAMAAGAGAGTPAHA